MFEHLIEIASKKHKLKMLLDILCNIVVCRETGSYELNVSEGGITSFYSNKTEKKEDVTTVKKTKLI